MHQPVGREPPGKSRQKAPPMTDTSRRQRCFGGLLPSPPIGIKAALRASPPGGVPVSDGWVHPLDLGEVGLLASDELDHASPVG
jgi:hypothetical protein